MNETDRNSERKMRWAWIGILCVAAVVYTIGITHESIWYDEAYSSVIASYPPWRIPALVMVDNHPPLYYMLLSLVRMALGSSEWALRSLSVLGSISMVALGAGPLRRLIGNRSAFLYAVVVLFTPAMLIYAHEARTYSLAICSVTAAVIYACLAINENRVKDWVLFGVFSLCSAYLHYYGLIATFFMHAIVFFWLLVKRRQQLKRYLIIAAGVVALYLPWLIVFIKQTMSASKAFWLGDLSWGAIAVSFLQPFAHREQFPVMSFDRFLAEATLTQYLACGLACLLAIFGFSQIWRRKSSRQDVMGRFAFGVYLGVIAATITVSLVLFPLFFSRYMLVVSGLFLMLVVLGMSKLPGKLLPWIALALFASLNLFTIKDIYTQHYNHPMKQLVAKLESAIQPGDLVITSDSYSLGPAFYYLPEAVHYHQNNPIEAQWGHVLNPFVPPLHYETDLQELLASHKSFWYITCNSGASLPVYQVIQGASGWVSSGLPVRVIEPNSPISFNAQKYVHH